MIRILHMENDSSYHDFIKSHLLGIDEDIEFAVAESFEDAVAALASAEFDCVLTNDRFEELSSTDAVERLRSEGITLPVLVLTDDEGNEDSQSGREASVDDLAARVAYEKFNVIYRSINVLSFINCRLKAPRSKDAFPNDLQADDIVSLKRCLSALTKRETEILDLLAGGNSNKEIGAELGISYFTVVNHVRNLYKKLDIHSRAEAIHFTLRAKALEIFPDGTQQDDEVNS